MGSPYAIGIGFVVDKCVMISVLLIRYDVLTVMM
jgi:hypothetical protein